MISKEKEDVELVEPFECVGPVEVWLNGLIGAIRKTLRQKLNDAQDVCSGMNRELFLKSFPAQIVVLCSRIMWTFEVGRSFEQMMEGGNETALKDYLKRQIADLGTLTEVVQQKLDSCTRKKIINLITVDVHAR